MYIPISSSSSSSIVYTFIYTIHYGNVYIQCIYRYTMITKAKDPMEQLKLERRKFKNKQEKRPEELDDGLN